MNIQDNRVKNLRRFIETHGTAAAVARKFDGVDASYLSQILNRHRNFGERSARNIEQLCNLKDGYFDVFNAESIPGSSDEQPRLGLIPLFTFVTAGNLCATGRAFTKDDAQGWMYCHLKHSDQTFALTITGDSMSPNYLDGSTIYVDPKINPEHNDDVVVCSPEGKASFKRLQITQDGNLLVALNPDFPNRILPVPEGTVVCGVVIYSGSAVGRFK
jgi:SOS-response transcriptional repressor LexA